MDSTSQLTDYSAVASFEFSTSDTARVAVLLEYLLQQPKYRCFFGRTNVKVSFVLWIQILGSDCGTDTASRGFLGSILGLYPIGCVVFGLAHKALKSGGESGSLRPVIMHTMVLLVILGTLAIVCPPLLYFNSADDEDRGVAFYALLLFLFLMIFFLLQLWTLFVFRRAREFLEEAKEIRDHNKQSA